MTLNKKKLRKRNPVAACNVINVNLYFKGTYLTEAVFNILLIPFKQLKNIIKSNLKVVHIKDGDNNYNNQGFCH